jgi:pilus assembly protein FimV
MLQRKLALLIGFISFVGAPLASALGLGELTLQSTLNEPFRAEMHLNDVGSLNRGELIISFASQQEFDRNHLERHFFYNEFEFEVVWSDSESPKVLITSHSVVREPFLDFIVQARWPNGRVQREYTVLMDKPAVID